jgi:putative transposase
MTKPPNPFRWFDSSPEVIRLVVMMYVRYQGCCQTKFIAA